ncbi:MAG: DUF4157 domain-containing protein [Deltaproteobacteria bacterium]|nr:DUF4157 domain-containing protein [Deltaproteobacteria bacterium]
MPGVAVTSLAALQAAGGNIQMASWAAVQREGGGGGGTEAVHAAAAEGVAGSGSSMPHGDAIQSAFGRHDVSGIQAHVGGKAAEASSAIGAEAYATGSSVAFKDAPSLHTAAHEAAHVVQQRAGVSLAGGVGQSGDSYEQHADAVADAVVSGKSAEPILDKMAGGGAGGGVQKKAVQREDTPPGPAPSGAGAPGSPARTWADGGSCSRDAGARAPRADDGPDADPRAQRCRGGRLGPRGRVAVVRRGHRGSRRQGGGRDPDRRRPGEVQGAEPREPAHVRRDQPRAPPRVLHARAVAGPERRDRHGREPDAPRAVRGAEPGAPPGVPRAHAGRARRHGADRVDLRGAAPDRSERARRVAHLAQRGGHQGGSDGLRRARREPGRPAEVRRGGREAVVGQGRRAPAAARDGDRLRGADAPRGLAQGRADAREGRRGRVAGDARRDGHVGAQGQAHEGGRRVPDGAAHEGGAVHQHDQVQRSLAGLRDGSPEGERQGRRRGARGLGGPQGRPRRGLFHRVEEEGRGLQPAGPHAGRDDPGTRRRGRLLDVRRRQGGARGPGDVGPGHRAALRDRGVARVQPRLLHRRAPEVGPGPRREGAAADDVGRHHLRPVRRDRRSVEVLRRDERRRARGRDRADEPVGLHHPAEDQRIGREAHLDPERSAQAPP